MVEKRINEEEDSFLVQVPQYLLEIGESGSTEDLTIQAQLVLDRIEAPTLTQLLDWREVECSIPQLNLALELCLPLGEAPHREGEHGLYGYAVQFDVGAHYEVVGFTSSYYGVVFYVDHTKVLRPTPVELNFYEEVPLRVHGHS